MKGFMKVFTDGLAMWREWTITGLLRRFMYGSVMIVAQWISDGKVGLIL